MRAYERFLNYVKIHTTSSEESGTHPSFEGEFALAHLLEEELNRLGLADVTVDDHCYVYGVLPGNLEGETKENLPNQQPAAPAALPSGDKCIPPLGLIAHMDTSCAAPGKDVKPVLHENYDGGDLTLPGSGAVLSPKQFPALARMKGETVITSDGTTLLGADDKAGIAEIMTVLETLVQEQIPHGDLYVCFTPDEEIGEGTDFFDFQRFAARAAYTVDGGDVNALEYENFNAASAEVRITGLSVHPGEAKDKMRNASQLAMEFHAMLPERERPEHTEDREGFFHLTQMRGRVDAAFLSYIIRDHDKTLFAEKKQLMQKCAAVMNAKYGENTVQLELTDSYYNMREKIEPCMHLVDIAREAVEQQGMVPEVVPIRGGTDGARLSFEGIPCPNLGTGGFFFHGLFECISVERMDRAADVLLSIVKMYTEYFAR